MSMMFDALRVLEMEHREQEAPPFLSEVSLFATKLTANDLSADKFAGQRMLKPFPGHEDSAVGRSKMDKEQLETLRRQVEEDYKLDIAAIERLQRRFLDASSARSDSAPSSSTSPGTFGQASEWATPPAAPVVERQSDEPRSSSRADAERWMQGAHR